MPQEKLVNWQPLIAVWQSMSPGWKLLAGASIFAIVGDLIFFVFWAIPWSKFGVAEWAYWVGAIGSVGAIFLALRLATAETRRRRSEDLSKARLTAIHIHIALLHMEAIAHGVHENLQQIQEIYQTKIKYQGQNIEDFADLAGRLGAIIAFPASGLIPLVALPGNCADKIALGQGLIDASAKILRDSLVLPMKHEEFHAFIADNLAILGRALHAIGQARAVVVKQAQPALTPEGI